MSSQCQSINDTSYQTSGYLFGLEQFIQSCFDGFEDDMMLDVLTNNTEFVRLLSEVEDADSFNQRILAVLKPLGFSDYAVVRKTLCRDIDIPFSSIPKELIAIYKAKKYYRYDMVLDYLEAGNLDPIYLSMIAHVIDDAPLMTHTFKQNLKILALYKRFDVNDAYLIPIKSNKRSDKNNDNCRVLLSVIAKGATREEFSLKVRRCKPILHVLAEAVNYIAETKFYPPQARQVINPRPLRLLTTMAKQDLSLAQAANSLCISIDTANKHMALAKKALGTRSQANAVYLAIKLGFIDL